ncbi:flagellar biosynthetic protein FliO [Ruicaihuangia caeni]|uniref:Flagellar biosynthetic protein FliO n=1 Tax=Ruicaihuangia caeni TaxID=3042517 RepID=A0AAW6T245_9MICO|nr:flagellar biosynthetic protein FliO [Klugiella sp. YN-L-19]MDI2097895.1 flagellar biosynthetic protein FliO [Klugiella sp. YN-L-19]
MDEFLLALRVLLTLAALLAVLWWVQRRVARRQAAKREAPAIAVVSRQALTPKAQAVMIEADGRRLLLGVTEHSVTVLHADADAPPAETASSAGDVARRARLTLAPSVAASDLAASDAPDAELPPALADVTSFEAALARAAANRDGAAANRDGAAANRDGAAANRDGAAANRDGAAANRDGAAANRDGAAANRDGAAANRGAPQPTAQQAEAEPLRRPRNNRRRITPETVGWRAYGGELLRVARGR